MAAHSKTHFPLSLSLSVLAMTNRAKARFGDLLTEFCVLNAAPLSWQCNVGAAHPSLPGTLGQLFALCLDAEKHETRNLENRARLDA